MKNFYVKFISKDECYTCSAWHFNTLEEVINFRDKLINECGYTDSELLAFHGDVEL